MTDARMHWEAVYGSRLDTAVSWHQPVPEPSLSLIKSTSVPLDAAIVDIGGGASRLVDALLADGFSDITVLDVSKAALDAAQRRLEHIVRPQRHVEWIVADVTTWEHTLHRYDVWHDRAVFHFLTEATARTAYIERLFHALKPNGFVVMGTFALDGPEKCSGLPVMRYDADRLCGELGHRLRLLDDITVTHVTPSKVEQQFQFVVLQALG